MHTRTLITRNDINNSSLEEFSNVLPITPEIIYRLTRSGTLNTRLIHVTSTVSNTRVAKDSPFSLFFSRQRSNFSRVVYLHSDTIRNKIGIVSVLFRGSRAIR